MKGTSKSLLLSFSLWVLSVLAMNYLFVGNLFQRKRIEICKIRVAVNLTDVDSCSGNKDRVVELVDRGGD